MIFNLMLCLLVVVIYLLTHINKKEQQKNDKLFLTIVFVLLFFVVATREMTIGNDTISYINLFKYCDKYKWSILNANYYYEKGYLIFNVLLSYISSSPRFFMYVMSFIFNYSVCKFIKENSNNYLMSILMYINLLFFYQSMTMMRQFLALAIVLLFSFKYVKNRSVFKFFITIFFASLFHSSAFIAIFIYPIYHLKYSRKRVCVIILGSIFVLLSLGEIYSLFATFLNKETYYLGMVGVVKLGNFISTLIYAVMFIFSLFVVRQDKRNEYSFFLYNLLFASAICFVSINMAVLSRASQYYAIFSIVSLPNIIESNIKYSKTFMNTIIVLLMILYSSIVMIYRPEWNSAYNYKSCIIERGGYICE